MFHSQYDLVEMVIHMQSPCSQIRMSICSSQYRDAGRVKNKEIGPTVIVACHRFASSALGFIISGRNVFIHVVDYHKFMLGVQNCEELVWETSGFLLCTTEFSHASQVLDNIRLLNKAGLLGGWVVLIT